MLVICAGGAGSKRDGGGGGEGDEEVEEVEDEEGRDSGETEPDNIGEETLVGVYRCGEGLVIV